MQQSRAKFAVTIEKPTTGLNASEIRFLTL